MRSSSDDGSSKQSRHVVSSRSRRESAGRLGRRRSGTEEIPNLRLDNLLGRGAGNCAAIAPLFFEAGVDADDVDVAREQGGTRVLALGTGWPSISCSDEADDDSDGDASDASAPEQTSGRESLSGAAEGFRGVAFTMAMPIGSLECETRSCAGRDEMRKGKWISGERWTGRVRVAIRAWPLSEIAGFRCCQFVSAKKIFIFAYRYIT